MAADSVGPVGASTAANYAVAVTKKQQSQEAVEGQESVQLIQSASAPQLESSGSVGTKLNFFA
ncbi:MAG TPA: hypothetical protein VIK01_24635 [Polyangiaceae bacterium]